MWFCPSCIGKWSHLGGNSTRWILVWEEEFRLEGPEGPARAWLEKDWMSGARTSSTATNHC
eukprot:4235825-Amphidinium_carterae.1